MVAHKPILKHDQDSCGKVFSPGFCRCWLPWQVQGLGPLVSQQDCATCLTSCITPCLHLLQCLLLLTMLLLRPASNDADQWQGSFASWEDASKQLQANEHEWAPPGAFAAALSTFKATLQDVTHSTNSLKEVCSSVFSCPNGCST